MYNPQRIETAFFGLAGIRQTDNPDFDKLPESVLYNGSNLLISHPLINIENLDMTARNYSLFPYPDFDNGATYAQGDRVRFNGLVYESLTAGNIGNQPDASPAQWSEISLLGLYLEDLYKTAGSEVLNKVFNYKKLHGQTKTLLQNLRLTEGVGGFNDRIINSGSLVGVSVKLLHRQNIQAIINRIGFQFTQPQIDLPVYIYHSSQIEPLATLTINYDGVGSLRWSNLDHVLNFLDDTHDAGGYFFIMYDQNDIAGQAIKKKHNFDAPPCSYCNKREANNYTLYSKYLLIQTIEVTAANRNPDNDVYLWDLEKTKQTPDNNFGLNFEFTLRCDLTDFIIQQKDVFAYAYRDMLVYKMIEGMANSTRQNGLNEKVMQMARAELQSEQVGGMGLKDALQKQLQAVNFEVSNLDSTCMPCESKTGLKYRSNALYR